MNFFAALLVSSPLHVIRDISYALRTFKRAPLAHFTIVATVALGLGLVTVAFTVLNALLFRADAVPQVHEMFAVERPRSSESERRPFTRAQLDALRRETDVFTDAYAQVPDVDSRIDGRLVFGTFVTGNFFNVLRVGAEMGRVLTPADDDAAAEQPVMVLSHRGWERLFARDPNVLSRTVVVNDVTFRIVGVMPDGFRGLAVVSPDDYWAPLSMFGRVRPAYAGHEASVPAAIVGRLKPGVSPEVAVARLAAWDARQPDPELVESGAPRIALVPKRGIVNQALEAVPVAAPLFFAFGLILLIGCANVANLLLARGVARQREIGIRLSLGATRQRVVRQLLTESLLLALLAAAGALAISRVVLEGIISVLMTRIPPDIGDVRLLVPGVDWRVLLFLVVGAGMSVMGFAFIPALHVTRVEPVRTMRGEVAADVRPGRARNFLIGLQVSASALLLISAAVFLRSAFSAAAFDPGMRTSDTLVIQIANESNRKAILRALAAEPAVGAFAASWSELSPRTGLAGSGDVKARVAYTAVSPDFFGVLDIALMRGRTFSPTESAPGVSVAVVSETTARMLWPNTDPVGQVVRLDPDPPSEPPQEADAAAFQSRSYTVAGVVRDVAGLRISPLPAAIVYLPTNTTTAGTSLIARVHGDPELARETLVDRLTTIDPDMGRQIVTLRTLARIDSYVLQMGTWFAGVLGALALALTLSGLFSVLSYLVEQRTREIGVRIALGGTRRDIARLVLSQSSRPVAFGLFLGGGSAAAVAALLLATPAAAGVGKIVHVLDPIAYVMSVLVIIAACVVAASIPAMRAARLDPALTLRQE